MLGTIFSVLKINFFILFIICTYVHVSLILVICTFEFEISLIIKLSLLQSYSTVPSYKQTPESSLYICIYPYQLLHTGLHQTPYLEI
jgi:hypothetical protein